MLLNACDAQGGPNNKERASPVCQQRGGSETAVDLPQWISVSILDPTCHSVRSLRGSRVE